jgi:glycerol-3-phosphate dehydrogenase
MHDLIVVGGGIHGVAVARDASRRGLSVLLLERGDIASGTSSRTSKLVHGGIRYLETGQFGLVREALRERATLLRIAPAFVRPLPFLLPHHPGEGRSRAVVGFGLWLYGSLARRDALAARGALTPAQTIAAVPGISTDRLAGASRFWDAQMDDAPLCVALALDAERAGATVRAHTELTALARLPGGRAWRAHFRDAIDGVEGEAEGRLVINAAGPWADSVRALARGRSAPLVRRTRGTHVVMPVRASEQALLLTARRDGRVFFVLPWGAHSLIGTTDLDDETEPSQVGPRAEDVRYLLEEASRAVPGTFARVRPVRTFAGVRSLARAGGRPWENTREHRVVAEPGMRTIVGGKYTTHRSLAERVVNEATRSLAARVRPCDTAVAPVPDPRAESGTRFDLDFPRRIEVEGGFVLTEADVARGVRHEKARRLDDVLLRRTRLWLDGRALRAAAVPCAAWMAPLVGWTDRRRSEEVNRLLAMLDREEAAIAEGTA